VGLSLDSPYLSWIQMILQVHHQIAMDIIIYSEAEMDYLKEKGSDFVKEIENTGKILYEK